MGQKGEVGGGGPRQGDGKKLRQRKARVEVAKKGGNGTALRGMLKEDVKQRRYSNTESRCMYIEKTDRRWGEGWQGGRCKEAYKRPGTKREQRTDRRNISKGRQGGETGRETGSKGRDGRQGGMCVVE